MANAIDIAISELVNGNRVLGHEGILDVYGHVSIRHPDNPDRFLMSRARSPEVVEPNDILEFEIDGSPVVANGPRVHGERFIHASVYEARPDVMAVCHNHTLSILPFSISKSTALKAVIHPASFLGTAVPLWDIADEFGAETNLQVRNIDHGRSLARTLGTGSMALMRGHGSVVVGNTVDRLVLNCIAMDRNATVQLRASQLGEYQPLHAGEIPRTSSRTDDSNRSREYFRIRAGLE